MIDIFGKATLVVRYMTYDSIQKASSSITALKNGIQMVIKSFIQRGYDTISSFAAQLIISQCEAPHLKRWDISFRKNLITINL